MSSAAAAHLAQAEGGESGSLPAHIARAQAARPKLTILDGELEAPVLGEPLALLKHALAELQTATFRDGDAEIVKAQFLHLEWIMRTAMMRYESVGRYGTALAAARRKSLLERMSLFRRGTSASREVAHAAHPVAEPAHHDDQLGQAKDCGAMCESWSRESFLQDAREAQERQSVRLDRPGRLVVNGPGRRSEPALEEEGEFAV